MNKHFTVGRAGEKVRHVVIHHNAGILFIKQIWEYGTPGKLVRISRLNPSAESANSSTMQRPRGTRPTLG